MAAGGADESRLNVGQLDIIRPAIAVAPNAKAVAVILDFVKPFGASGNLGPSHRDTELKRP